VKGLLGSDASGQSVPDAVAFVTGEEDEDYRALITGLGGGPPHGRLARRPFVPHPYGDATVVDHGFVLPPVKVELAGGLPGTVGELQVAEGGLNGVHESFAAELAHARGVVADGGEAGAVVLFPLGVLLCEKPVGVAILHDATFGDEAVEEVGHPPSQPGTVLSQVLDEEVGEEGRGRSQAGFATEDRL
jgi:hypothetical protein